MLAFWAGLLDQNRKIDGSKKGPKVRKHGVSVFGQAHVSAKGGYLNFHHLASFQVPQNFIIFGALHGSSRISGSVLGRSIGN